MKAYLNVYWDKLESGGYGAFLQFETPSGERLPGILIEDVMPPECRDQAHEPKEAIEFIRLLSYALVPASFMRAQIRAARGRSKANPLEANLPPIDLLHYGMADTYGVISSARVRSIVALIANSWRERLEPGLIDQLFEKTDDLTAIEKRLIAFYRYRDLPKGDDRITLGQLLLPPECRDGSTILKDGQFETALRWLKRGGASGPTRQDNMLWNLNLRELSSDEALAAEKEKEAERAEYRRRYWQEYSKKVKRVFGVLSLDEYVETKARADEHGRSVWAQIWAESKAYRAGEHDPSPAAQANQEQLIGELRRIGNNLNQLAKLGHIEAKRGGGITGATGIGDEALRLIERLEAVVAAHPRSRNDR